MAVLYIAEYSELSFCDNGVLSGVVNGTGFMQAAPISPPLAEQTLVIGVSSVASNAFSAKTSFVIVSSDVPCSIAWGINPVATANNMRLAVNKPERFGVAGGKIAVISNS